MISDIVWHYYISVFCIIFVLYCWQQQQTDLQPVLGKKFTVGIGSVILIVFTMFLFNERYNYQRSRIPNACFTVHSSQIKASKNETLKR